MPHCATCVVVATAWVYMHATVPGTYSYSLESWHNKSWGFYDLDRETENGVVRIAVNGSRATTIEHHSYGKYFFLKDGWSFDTLYRDNEHLAYVVDSKARKIGVVQCFDAQSVCSPVRPRVVDNGMCSQAANQTIPGGRFIGLGRTADLTTARYKFRGGPLEVGGHTVVGRYTYEVALAPELGCELVESMHVTYNSVALPTDYTHFVTRSFKRELPSPNVFMLPNGFEILRDYLPTPFWPPVE
jgi:hypothetical protein